LTVTRFGARAKVASLRLAGEAPSAVKANSRLRTFLRELGLPREERRAARQERRVEEAIRSQRDDVAYSETARKAAAEAQRQRERAAGGSGLGPSG
jgi:hypothetical protein